MSSSQNSCFRCFFRLMFVSLALVQPGLALPQSTTEDQIVVTKHQVTVAARVLKYTARAGRLPIQDNETGEVHGQMFFVAYTLDSAARARSRPLTFLWNGGPGSSSSLVHLLGFGPKRLQTDGTAVDNQGTWLDQTDLVFVDPIGTGYSRPTRAEYGPEFYQTRGDAESVAEFIRVYRNRFEVWEAPLFLAGESYGVIRAASVIDLVTRRRLEFVDICNARMSMQRQMSTNSSPSYRLLSFSGHKYTPLGAHNLSSSVALILDTSLRRAADASDYFSGR